MIPSPERREDRRADVAIWVEEHTADALYFQRTKNLSLGGVFLEGTLPHPPGTRVELDLDLVESGQVRVEGEVVARGADAGGMAVRFVEMTDRARSRLAAYLERIAVR